MRTIVFAGNSWQTATFSPNIVAKGRRKRKNATFGGPNVAFLLLRRTPA